MFNSSGIKVFVYGTLRKGESNHHIIEGCTYLGTTVLKDYSMISMGFYPAAIPVSGGRIVGEVYEVCDLVMEDLDSLEGYNPRSPETSMYDRHIVKTEFGESWIYVYNSFIDVTNEDLFCDWKVN
jgi:gamma-glutamylcyclotransferase (GGCT)/AIG2-like uncharacterized protein YtfP